MTEFYDSSNRSWAVILTLGSAKRVKDCTGVDLLNPAALTVLDENGDVDVQKSTTTRLMTDDILIGDIVSTLIQNQAEQRGLNREQVLDLFDGTTLKNAQTAFLKEYFNFFMARGNLAGAKMAEALQEGLKAMGDEKLLGEILSGSPDAPDAQTSAT